MQKSISRTDVLAVDNFCHGVTERTRAGESTSRLMEEFHRNLRQGKAKDEALKDAMSTVRKTGRLNYGATDSHYSF